ncbi:MAG: hypothetical protein QNJ51_25800 [Calothrix sp. MO_167.B12]|nr:hypothetical protein [Calothrix sp. MO_167.B12]
MLPENNKNHIPQWTKRHDAFCLENKITPSAKLLWQWLIRQGIGTETEPDLAEFNTWVKRHRGKGYSRPTLKSALALLIDLRVIRLVKRFTWRIVRIVTRPLEWLKPKKNCRSRNKTSTSPPSNHKFVEQGVCSSSNNSLSEERVLEMESVLSECESAGIPFDPAKSPEILEYSLEEVRDAIALFEQRGGYQKDYRGRPKIANPQGWLLSCIRNGWVYKSEWSMEALFQLFGLKL